MASQKNHSLILVATGILSVATFASGCGKWKEKSKAAKEFFGGGGGGSGEKNRGESYQSPGPSGLDLTSFDLTLHTYESCDVLQEDVRAQILARIESDKAQKAYYEAQRAKWQTEGAASGGMEKAVADDASAPAETDADNGSGDGANDSITNVQEKGVDEADFAKLGTDHFYVQHGGWLEVMDRASLALIGRLDLSDLKNTTLYAEADRLIVIGSKDVASPSCGQYPLPKECYRPPQSPTVVRTYTAAKGAIPKLANERVYEDQYADSRFVGGKAILLFRSQLPLEGDARRFGGNSYHYYGYYSDDGYYSSVDSSAEPDIPAAPVTVVDGKVGGIACTQISKPYIKDLDFRLTKVVVVDTRDLAKEDRSAAVFGGGDQVYMTTTGLYLAKQGVNWQPFQVPADYDTAEWQEQNRKERILWETLVVTKVDFVGEADYVGPSAVGAVAGRVKDQWAFKEYASHDALAVATTTWAKFKPETTTEGQHNHLWVLAKEGETLALKAAINDFGPREDIRAARYLGAMAYIVTFEKTDPLFAFDLTDPLQPKLLSELKIPGFSVYLHPTSEGRLVGVGYDADDQGDFSWFQGIQVSLFDVSNPLDLKRLDVKVIGHRGSYSDVTGDHKAFFENKEYQFIGVPVVEKLKKEGAGAGGWEQGDRVTFTGAILYDLAGDALTEKARLSHSDLIAAECKAQNGSDYHWWQDTRRSLDINRLYTIDGRLLTVSRFGVKVHDLAAPATVTQTIKFVPDTADCATNNYKYGY